MMREQEHAGDPDLIRSIDHELPPRQQAALDTHLAQCASCCMRLEDLRTASTAASETYTSRAAPERAADSRARLEFALRAAASEGPAPWRIRLGAAVAGSPLRIVLAAAAAVVVLVVARPFSQPVLLSSSLPVPTLTPGAVSDMTAADLCGGARPSRLVTSAAREQVLRDYQMDDVSEDRYELDALVTPELGGTTEAGNLWPQRYDLPVWNARVKDQLERLLPELVCRREVELSQAQRDIATDWIAAYKKYFNSNVPLRVHATRSSDDDDNELVFAPATYVVEFRHVGDSLTPGTRAEGYLSLNSGGDRPTDVKGR